MAEDLADIANVGITAMAVLLKDLFKGYEQLTPLDVAASVSTGQVVLPIMAFSPLEIKLKTKIPKAVKCHTRLVVYSKNPKEPEPCSRFVHEHVCTDRTKFLEEVPNAVLEANINDEYTLLDLVTTLSAVVSDKVSFFYNTSTCEGIITYQIMVVHEFGKDNPYCISTAYLYIEVTK